jgi:hypothetical protein
MTDKQQLISLNEFNGADLYIMKEVGELAINPPHPLIGCIFGSAYGGEVEKIAELWGNKGTIYGFDTFEGHPKFLSKHPHPNSFDKDCMDYWYEQYGMEALKLEYQYDRLYNVRGFRNFELRKGLISKDSTKDLPYIDFAILDLDILESMLEAYEAIKGKYVLDNKLYLHDVYPPKHIERLHEWYINDVLGRDKWEKVEEISGRFLAIVKKTEETLW